jgi:hypothetical protein
VLEKFVKTYESDRVGREGMTVVVFLRTRKIGTAGCVEFGIVPFCTLKKKGKKKGFGIVIQRKIVAVGNWA